MTDKRDIRLKYFPSMAGFRMGDRMITNQDSACERNILFAAHGLKKFDIHPIYKEIGELNELRWLDELTADSEVTEVLREEPVRGPAYGSEHVSYSGRCDFIVTYEDGHEEIHECKGTASKSVRSEVMRKGQVKLNHLAQILSYMIQLELTDGKLVYGFYQYPWSENGDATNLICTASRVFAIKIADDGRVLIDGEPSAYTVLDQLHHMQRAVKIMETKEFGERPAAENAWSNPCKYCVFSSVCDRADTGMEYSLDDLLNMAEQAAANEQQREPNIFRPKQKPKQV